MKHSSGQEISSEILSKYKSRELIGLVCDYCNETFLRPKNRIQEKLKIKTTYSYCNNVCQHKHRTKLGTKKVICKYCNKTFVKMVSQMRKNNFCNSSCAAIYNNANKTKGTRISKLEVYLQAKLQELYSDLEIHYNRKNTINSELDIYIPSLGLAFELNGIFHYEPIYGESKLNQTQNNDKRKLQACLENKIELCIIDTSQQKRFTEKSSQKYLDIIIKIMKERLEGSRGL